MFFDVLDMTTAYMQYITLLLHLSPESLLSFYIAPLEAIQFMMLRAYDKMEEVQRYENPLRVDLPGWLPLDIRVQCVCVVVIGPLALSTLGLLFVYGKPAYAWFVCLLSSLFMFLFGFILLPSMAAFTFPGPSLPSKSMLGILGDVGLPLFAVLLAVGLVAWLRRDAVELERFIDEERERCGSQRITQQVVDRQGIDLVTVAAERVHSARREYCIAHLDVGDVMWQGACVLMLLIGSFVLLGAVPTPPIYPMQQSIVFKAVGSLTFVFFAVSVLWWITSMLKKGRRYLCTCSAAFDLHALSLIMAESRMQHPASLFPPLSSLMEQSRIADSPVRCLPCDFHNYTQKCATSFQQSLCATAQKRMDGFYKAIGVLIFVFYILLLLYLQLYVAQYGARMLHDVYPLEQRYHDVFTAEELYLQKFRFYRLSFLLQKIVLGFGTCFMQRGQHRRLAWVGILFFLVVSLIALCCAVYLRPLSRLTELIYFPPLQAVVHMCTLVVVTVLSRHEERRRDDLLQRRLVLGVTAAYVMSGAWEQQAQSSSPTQLQPGDSEAGSAASDREQQPSRQTGNPRMPEEDSDGEATRPCGSESTPRDRVSFNASPLASAAAAGISTVTGARVAALPQRDSLNIDSLGRTPAVMALSPAAPSVHHPKPEAERLLSPSSLTPDATVHLYWPSTNRACSATSSRRRAPSPDQTTAASIHPTTITTTASAHASVATVHSANADQALPALLLKRKWWDFTRALGAMAIERQWWHPSCSSATASRGLAEGRQEQQQRRRSMVSVAASSFTKSPPPLFQRTGPTSAASSAAVNACDHGSGASAAQPARRASEEEPPQRRKASFRQRGVDVDVAASAPIFGFEQRVQQQPGARILSERAAARFGAPPPALALASRGISTPSRRLSHFSYVCVPAVLELSDQRRAIFIAASSASAVRDATGERPTSRTQFRHGSADRLHSVAPADPLGQQFRCLCPLRERLKELHWEHCEQLTAVQHYIDCEINETVWRDGYDNAITDEYAVRELCGMGFKNNCTVVVGQGTVRLEGCDAAAVSEDAMQRW
ncbi:putative integral membrane protein [Leishmania donovani]|uniref:Putative integral membrane protein n=1 Tax=Leishmania donovani TaxID=5661 RepID=A0A504XVP4_LEIDO|nr:putative integral membrane protein [Leishmania donovani]